MGKTKTVGVASIFRKSEYRGRKFHQNNGTNLAEYKNSIISKKTTI
jgi:hypothetical protein